MLRCKKCGERKMIYKLRGCFAESYPNTDGLEDFITLHVEHSVNNGITSFNGESVFTVEAENPTDAETADFISTWK